MKSMIHRGMGVVDVPVRDDPGLDEMSAPGPRGMGVVDVPVCRGPGLADIVRADFPWYATRHAITDEQWGVLWDVAHCRTDVMGGYVDGCASCGTLRVGYNSCRNRHCPRCQRLAQERWVTAQASQLLPIPYFHVVFTLPHELNDLIRFNKRVCYDLLFRTVIDTLQSFARRKWGGELGITAVLHTWGQTLVEHIHLHCVVTGGALKDDGSRFIRCPAGYLFPVMALGEVFRAKYVQGLYQAYREGQLHFPGALGQYACEASFSGYVGSLPLKRWVVYSKGSFAESGAVLQYLGRYTHRVAISNSRLVSFSDGQVSFRYKDYRDGSRIKVMTLSADEFLRRYLSHVLPKGYVRIRHFGLVAPGKRRDRLARCRELLGASAPVLAETPTTAAMLYEVTGVDITVCPSCGHGPMLRRWTFPPGLSPPVRLLGEGVCYDKSA